MPVSRFAQHQYSAANWIKSKNGLSLSDLIFCHVVSCRLDEQPRSRWRPQLSSLQFQTLLQNLTAIKVRATFSQEGEFPLYFQFCLYFLLFCSIESTVISTFYSTHCQQKHSVLSIQINHQSILLVRKQLPFLMHSPSHGLFTEHLLFSFQSAVTLTMCSWCQLSVDMVSQPAGSRPASVLQDIRVSSVRSVRPISGG